MIPGKLALLTLVILTCASCQGAGPSPPLALSPPAGDIIIASTLPISGAFIDVVAADRAIRLAIKQHPTIGRFKLAYWSLDEAVATNAWPEKGIQNVSMMLDDASVLGMVGPYQSYMAYAELPIANGGDLVMISPTNSSTCLTQSAPNCAVPPAKLRPTGRNNFFRLEPTDPVQGTAMARYAAVNLGIKKVAVLNEWGIDGDQIARAFANQFGRQGGSVVLRFDFDPQAPGFTPNFTGFLQQAHDQGAQAIYALGNDDICVARSQMTDNASFLGTDGFSVNPDCITHAGNRSELMFGTKPDVDITGSKDPNAITAVKAFRQAYPNAPIPEYTFATYDCAEILIAAIERAVKLKGGGLPNRREVLDAMRDITYAGLTGNYSFDKNGDALSPLMSIYQVQNGKWVYLQKLDATATP